jgi:hypothetical protein
MRRHSGNFDEVVIIRNPAVHAAAKFEIVCVSTLNNAPDSLYYDIDESMIKTPVKPVFLLCE